MGVDIQTVWITISSIITGATIILNAIAPITKSDIDNKILRFLKRVMEIFSFNVKDDGKTTLEILIKKK